jgi:hypothetical protein
MRLKFVLRPSPQQDFLNEAQKYADMLIQPKKIAGFFERYICNALINNKYFDAFWNRLTDGEDIGEGIQ